MIKKIIKYFLLGILGLIFILFCMRTIYQVFIYPKEIKEKCNSFAIQSLNNEHVNNRDKVYELSYKICFRHYGLEPD